MRVQDLFIAEAQQLNEINMSPSSLRRLASTIDARAGMEFEMIVPNAESAEDSDMEPDYDQDERARHIEGIVNFFDDGDYNSSRAIRDLRERLQSDYNDWAYAEADRQFDQRSVDIIYDYLKNNANNDEIAEILGREDDDEETKDNYGRAEVSEAAEIVAGDSSNYWHQQASEEFRDEFMQDDNEAEWLSSEGIRYMSEIESTYDVSWPYWTSMDTGGASIDDIANSFSEAVGRPINASKSYHGARREPGKYVVEPDGSLEGDDRGDSGLEFVSPPLPIAELLSDLRKVKDWADKTGCYTNDSTGLHINVSVPALQNNSGQLDYVKLAILLGDERILNEFGRAGNSYCKSALKIVKERVISKPDDAAALLNQMKGHLADMASKAIHDGYTQKFTSINNKNGYIEFRSPGGDWLNETFDIIEPTLLRFVVALDAATDPEKYRQEYLTKLYKLLAPKSKDDTLAHFAKFAAGELPKQALKSFVRH